MTSRGMNMTKDELLKLYNSPAYRVANYDYVWRNDGSALTSFWSDYENRRAKELADELNRTRTELEKQKQEEQAAIQQEELKKEQAEANQNALLEKYMTAKTSLANSQIAYDSAVKQYGANSAEARTAKNNLDSDQWLVSHIGEKLGTVPSSESEETTLPVPVPVKPVPVVPVPSESSLSSNEISSRINQLERNFTEGKEVSLSDIASLERKQNITEADKDKLSKLRQKIIAKANSGKANAETKEQITEALKYLDSSDNRKFLKKHGYKVTTKNGKWIAYKEIQK